MSDTLDRLIDDAARSLTTAPRPGNFRARVLSRIHAAEAAPSRMRWLIPGAAIATACIALLVYVGGQDNRAQLKSNPTAAVAPVTATAGAGVVEQGIVSSPSPVSPAVKQRAETMSTVSTGAAPQIVLMPPPPGFERLDVATIQIDPLPMDSLAIDGLGTQ